jgi:hypothetical protein
MDSWQGVAHQVGGFAGGLTNYPAQTNNLLQDVL